MPLPEPMPGESTACVCFWPRLKVGLPTAGIAPCHGPTSFCGGCTSRARATTGPSRRRSSSNSWTQYPKTPNAPRADFPLFFSRRLGKIQRRSLARHSEHKASLLHTTTDEFTPSGDKHPHLTFSSTNPFIEAVHDPFANPVSRFDTACLVHFGMHRRHV